MGGDGGGAATADRTHHRDERRNARLPLRHRMPPRDRIARHPLEFVPIERQAHHVGDPLTDQRADQPDIGAPDRRDDRQAGAVLAHRPQALQRARPDQIHLDHQNLGPVQRGGRHRLVGIQGQSQRGGQKTPAKAIGQRGNLAGRGDDQHRRHPGLGGRGGPVRADPARVLFVAPAGVHRIRRREMRQDAHDRDRPVGGNSAGPRRAMPPGSGPIRARGRGCAACPTAIAGVPATGWPAPCSPAGCSAPDPARPACGRARANVRSAG